MIDLSSDYWNNRYKNKESGWDLGKISPPLQAYIQQLEDKTIDILIPGAGNAYEADFLFSLGFKNVYVLDFAQEPLHAFVQRCPQFPASQLIRDDFFNHSRTYDLIIEQTFFCALNPALRKEYALHMNRLLKVHGKLVGLLFNDAFTSDGPPFGGRIDEYQALFKTLFIVKVLDPCYNSIKPRQGRELFMILEKQDELLPSYN